MKKKKKSAQDIVNEVSQDIDKRKSAQEFLDEAEDKEMQRNGVSQVSLERQLDKQKKPTDIAKLQSEIEMLERKSAEELERKNLIKKKKALEFSQTGFGKFGIGVTKAGKQLLSVGEKFTRPKPTAQRVREKLITPSPVRTIQQPARLLSGNQLLSGEPQINVSAPARQKSFDEIQADINKIVNFGTTPSQPLKQQIKAKVGKKSVKLNGKTQAKSKGFDLNEVLRSLPQ